MDKQVWAKLIAAILGIIILTISAFKLYGMSPDTRRRTTKEQIQECKELLSDPFLSDVEKRFFQRRLNFLLGSEPAQDLAPKTPQTRRKMSNGE